MLIHSAYVLALLSTIAFIVLWFWVVRKELRAKKSMLLSAKSQLLIYRKKYELANGDLEAEGVLKTSLAIYHQTQELYNRTLKNPCFFIPGVLMGFREIKSDP